MSKRIDTSALRMAVLRAINDGRRYAIAIERNRGVVEQLARLPRVSDGGKSDQDYVRTALTTLSRSGMVGYESPDGWRTLKKGRSAL